MAAHRAVFGKTDFSIVNALGVLIPYFLTIGVLALIIHRTRTRGRASPLNENLLRGPACSLERVRESLGFDSMLYLTGVALIPMIFLISYQELQRWPWLFITLGAGGTLICATQTVRKFSLIPRLHLAIDAEVATGQELGFLMRDGAWLYHDIPYAYGNIDHVIVSAGGVFAIETKGVSKTKHSGNQKEGWKVQVADETLHFPSGATRKPIEQAKRHAQWLAAEIERRCQVEAPVQAVVALPGWHITGGWDDACLVINPKRGKALRKRVLAQRIPSEDVDKIAGWLDDLSRSVRPAAKRFDARHVLDVE